MKEGLYKSVPTSKYTHLYIPPYTLHTRYSTEFGEWNFVPLEDDLQDQPLTSSDIDLKKEKKNDIPRYKTT